MREWAPPVSWVAAIPSLRSGDLVPDLARRAGDSEARMAKMQDELAMLEEMGIPITTEQGRHGGYRLVAGFKLPPLMFTQDETLAVALAQEDVWALAFPHWELVTNELKEWGDSDKDGSIGHELHPAESGCRDRRRGLGESLRAGVRARGQR